MRSFVADCIKEFLKRLCSILLLLLLASLASVIPMRYGLRKVAKVLIQEKLRQEQNQIIFSEEELLLANWENSREFSLNGSIYDVAKMSRDSNGRKLFHCVRDELEWRLLLRSTPELAPIAKGDCALRSTQFVPLFDWFKEPLFWQELPAGEMGISAPQIFVRNVSRLQRGFTDLPKVPPEDNFAFC